LRPDGKRVAVTGAAGFIGRNLVVRLKEAGYEPLELARATGPAAARAALRSADVVVHLASAVRPADPVEFMRSRAYAVWTAEAIAEGGRRPLVICCSSSRAEEDTAYGRCKRAIEGAMLSLEQGGEARVAVFRLPGVFGKWARPNYNSCIATFCHNLARGLPIQVHDEAAPLSLLYVDDLIEQWLLLIDCPPLLGGLFEPTGVHATTVGEVAQTLRGFAEQRRSGEVSEVGSGLKRALYATFISALPAEAFSYPLTAHTDARGSFTEILKTPSSGQVSVFTAHPGVTRGGHYHHSKVEKFLIVQGEALFRFRNIATGEALEVRTTGQRPVVVETIPGWTHDVTNIGSGELVSLLWASEVFDRARPDTVMEPV
jgi:UDP-2-acetamido-2,6-beta-L-arabino-hexul-4-ose reductase